MLPLKKAERADGKKNNKADRKIGQGIATQTIRENYEFYCFLRHVGWQSPVF